MLSLGRPRSRRKGLDWIRLAQDRNNKQAVSGALAKLRKATTNFVTFVRPHGTRLPLDCFPRNLIFEYVFENASRKTKIH